MKIIREIKRGVTMSVPSPHRTGLWRALLLVPASELPLVQIQAPSSSGGLSTRMHVLGLKEQ